MSVSLINRLLGCRHDDYSFPITMTDGNGHKLTYTTCVDCGLQRKYDIKRMRHAEFERGEDRQLACPNYGQGVVV